MATAQLCLAPSVDNLLENCHLRRTASTRLAPFARRLFYHCLLLSELLSLEEFRHPEKPGNALQDLERVH